MSDAATPAPAPAPVPSVALPKLPVPSWTGVVLALVAGVALSLLGTHVWEKWHPGPAPSIALPGEVTGEPADLIPLEATSSGPVRWHADKGVRVLPFPPGSKSALAVAKAPGEYHVWAWTAGGGQPSQEAVTVLKIAGPTPPPPPVPPGPGPVPPVPPTPPPVHQPLHVSIFFDPAAQTPVLASLLESPTLRKAMEDGGHKFRIYPAGDPLATGKFAPFITKAGGCPALIMQAGDGRVLDSEKLPADEAGVISAVKKVGG